MERLKRMFGEPAAAVGLLQVVLAALLTIDGLHLTNEWVALIMAFANAVAALYTMIATKTVALAVIIESFKATIALIAGFGWELSPETTAGLIGVVSFVVALYQRTQTGAAINLGFHDEPVATPALIVPGEVISNAIAVGTGPSVASGATTTEIRFGNIPPGDPIGRGMPTP